MSPDNQRLGRAIGVLGTIILAVFLLSLAWALFVPTPTAAQDPAVQRMPSAYQAPIPHRYILSRGDTGLDSVFVLDTATGTLWVYQPGPVLRQAEKKGVGK